MSRLAPASAREPASLEVLTARLDDMRERLAEAKAGGTACRLTLGEIRAELDRLLDELIARLATRD